MFVRLFHELSNSKTEAITSISEGKKTAQDAIKIKVMAETVLARSEILEKAIRFWKNQQLSNIEKNLIHYCENVFNRNEPQNFK